ncbi:MAG: hypothetical protein JWP12_3727 [Bacteroidetes bacterium]|nr:hypothetical protein [Bacteroidota bacterium]
MPATLSYQTSFSTTKTKPDVLPPFAGIVPPRQARSLVFPVLFLHIPKTAGSTMQNIINENYRWRFLKIHTNNLYRDPGVFTKLSVAERQKIKVIKGHINFNAYLENYPGEITCFTFLRDPIKRCISDFNFIRQDKVHFFHKRLEEGKYTLKDLLKEGPVRQFDNCHVRMLASAHELEFGGVNEEIYQRALKKFDTHFELFGICERFDESLIHFKRSLGWNFPLYLKTNVTNKKQSVLEFDEETNQLLLQYNHYDILLYEYACKKFDAVIRSYPADFQKEVQRFQKLNKRHAPFRRIFRKIVGLFYKSPNVL